MILDFSWLRRGLSRPRRFPDPCEDEYRRGWLWGWVCGACLGALLTGVLVGWLS